MVKGKYWFGFNKKERKILLVFFVLILLLQVVYFYVSSQNISFEESQEEKQWLSNQAWVDSLKAIEQAKHKLNPFNPNFITDFKGYQLGMSVQEIDRLLTFRKEGKFVNSAKEFQQVTGISDSLLQQISPYFKFPDWATNPKNNTYQLKSNSQTTIVKDLNKATQEDLIKLKGIGEKLSTRILDYRTALGAFVSMEQLRDVYGLSEEVITELNKYFTISDTSGIKKIYINELSIKELGAFPYFKYPVSKNIVLYRSMNGGIKNKDELSKIPDFPVEKIEIIALYLGF